ncbi:FAD-dependent oxidoreductase [Streptomyces sp. NPDC006733]|uniref:NAD(P)/FAD-dependent oxidoreductase n=1 Tax=Streptomyces sp. NPDC006733 TaxID=3155460 RepID=UPI0033E54093
MTGRIAIAGASLGGLRAAEQVRGAGWTGEIVAIGDESRMPYNRPPLSKEALAGRAPFSALAFRPKAAAAVIWRLGTAVASARLHDRTLELADGASITFDGLVIATGIRPRRLRCPGPSGPGSGRYTVRTLDDAQALRAELSASGVRLVVVGAGFIGCEVAATARGLGVRVTVVEPEPLPLVRALGDVLAADVLRRHREHGVTFALGRTVERFTGSGPDDTGRITGVVLDDGTELAADVVVEAIGSVANTEWLDGNGLDLSDGVLCDARLRAGGLPHVVAVGDVARFPNARYDEVPRRVEHWSIPGDCAKHAARTLVDGLAGGPRRLPRDDAPFTPLPSFWSDQYDCRLQSFGAPALGAADARVLEHGPGQDLLIGYYAAGRLVGVAAIGGPAAAAKAAGFRAALLHRPAAA